MSPSRVHAASHDASAVPAVPPGAQGKLELPRKHEAQAAAVAGEQGEGVWAPGGSGGDSGKENAGARPAAHGKGRAQGAGGSDALEGRQGGSELWVPGGSGCNGGPEDTGAEHVAQVEGGLALTGGADAAAGAITGIGDETWSLGGSSSDGGKENAGAASDPDCEPRRVPPLRCGELLPFYQYYALMGQGWTAILHMCLCARTQELLSSVSDAQITEHTCMAGMGEARQALRAVQSRECVACGAASEGCPCQLWLALACMHEPDTRCTAQAVADSCECTAAHSAAHARFTRAETGPALQHAALQRAVWRALAPKRRRRSCRRLECRRPPSLRA